jgi:hypothetical protein
MNPRQVSQRPGLATATDLAGGGSALLCRGPAFKVRRACLRPRRADVEFSLGGARRCSATYYGVMARARAQCSITLNRGLAVAGVGLAQRFVADAVELSGK